MNDTTTTVQNSMFAATATGGVITFINENSTVISLGITLFFGLIYASCHIFNTYQNHKERMRNRQSMIDDVIKELNDNGETKAADAVRRVSK
jgi:NADPH:quinone reductase-like Zn-dependent oxidoreductase